MRNLFKFIFFSFLVSVFVFIPTESEKIKAGSEDNVSGYAWSENIGWISFNNTTGGGTIDYGVNVDGPTGVVSGYAWSENIGWIKFDPVGPYPICPSTTCPVSPDYSAKFSSATKKITGWARALNYGGGWDGWILLGPIVKNSVDYGVRLEAPSSLRGWAWADQVIGWISFNCLDRGAGVCDASDYGVIASINQPPIAAVSCSLDNCATFSDDCIIYTKESLTFCNESTDVDSTNCPGDCNNDIIESQFDVTHRDGSSYDGDPDYSCSGVCDFTVQSLLLGRGAYTAELEVRDQYSSDSITKDFTILQEASAGFMCSLDEGEVKTWPLCVDIRPEIGAIVYVTDDKSLAEHSTASELLGGGMSVINSRTWELNGVSFGEGPNPVLASVRINNINNVIKLTITDAANRTDSEIKTIAGHPPLPEWTEIKPF